MRHVFTAEGWRVLRGSWIALALVVATAVATVTASHWYVAREARDQADSRRRLQEARARLEAAQRERDNLQASAEVFRTLVDRGLLEGENRLGLVEQVNRLRAQHALFALDYEIAPQRPLRLAGGRDYPAVEVLASRVRLSMRALHEGDVLAFLDALAAADNGFHPLDRCALSRIEVADPEALAPRVEAQCAFEWITIRDRHAKRQG